MARRLVRRRLGRDVDPRAARGLGMLMRTVYGPSWGVVAALLARRRGRTLSDAVTVAGAIWLFELVALPQSGATPPLCEWPRGEAALDMTNALAYSIVTCAVLRRFSARPGARRAGPASV